MGDDEGLMPFITEANVACGFHGSALIHMRTTVDLAKRYDVKVGALKAFLDMPGVGLNHVKPHGALHGMAARNVLAHLIDLLFGAFIFIVYSV